MYQTLLRPILFKTTDPEWIHHVVLHALRYTPMASMIRHGRKAPSKPVSLWGLTFRNPLGLAAGFDKDAVAVKAWEQLGFGYIEIGTVTRHAQPGNATPRIFRYSKQQALINRMGFPNEGASAVAERLRKLRSSWGVPDFPIGVNIGKSKMTPLDQAPDDYLYSFKALYDVGDFFVVNVSSPNTPGLRSLQSPDHLHAIVDELQKFNREAKNKPILVKIAPDLHLDDITALLGVILRNNLAGIVATNTTLDHSSVSPDEMGGLSGRPLTEKSTEIISFISKETNGKLPIIGVGGIFNRDDYQRKIDAGASLVQLYTGFIYQGPDVAYQILEQK